MYVQSIDYGESVAEPDRFLCSEQEVVGVDVTSGQCGVFENDGDNKAHLQWRLEEVRVIKYGTLRKLVSALSSDTGQLEVTNVNTFLTTCRTFASTKEVVDELIARYLSTLWRLINVVLFILNYGGESHCDVLLARTRDVTDVCAMSVYPSVRPSVRLSAMSFRQTIN